MPHFNIRSSFLLVIILTSACARAAEDAEPATGSEQILSLLFPLVLLGGLFYMMLIRPQRRRQRQARELRSALEVGDEVRTIGGIHGRVKSMTETDVIIDIGAGNTLRIARQAIAERLGLADG